MKDRLQSEFKWERLFREEEKNVREYLTLLPKYIYLPGEDVLTSGQKSEFESLYFENDNEEEEFELFWKKHKDSSIVEKLLKLSKSWLLIQNAVLSSNKEKSIGLKISAILAISTGRLLTIIASSDENPEFCIAHYKRLRREFCFCENNMRILIKLSPRFNDLIKEKISVIMELIAFSSDKIFELRKKIS